MSGNKNKVIASKTISTMLLQYQMLYFCMVIVLF